MSTPLPTYEQVVDLPAQVDREVPAKFIDVNGHMNIRHYLDLAAGAVWSRCQSELGMSEDYIAGRHLSSFTAEHHLTYIAEMREGERVSAHVRLVERSDKSLHAMSLLLNRSQERLAYVMETVLVHVDLRRRRPTPYPDDVAALIDAALKADDRPWAPPLSGVMGVRRRA